ncbi:hypothetical protein AYI70_g4876 [Smittium culicis]|uniref:Uncharacterized protein n=1 Tax=Smittium culicis TaxID=133412 RepID=A0A1R1XWY9_9FUNG|nr:hypothetical protein AYI70_g4876 [Smittium culicis]
MISFISIFDLITGTKYTFCSFILPSLILEHRSLIIFRSIIIFMITSSFKKALPRPIVAEFVLDNFPPCDLFSELVSKSQELSEFDLASKFLLVPCESGLGFGRATHA